MAHNSISRQLIRLHLLESAVTDMTYSDVLLALATGIASAEKQVALATDSGDAEWAEIVTDDECDVVEDLLGAAFIVCQVKITAVLTAALRFRAVCLECGKAFASFGEEPTSVLKFGVVKDDDSKVGAVELIWALANYFKHRDEWQGPWEKMQGHPRRTIKTIEKAGLSSGCSANLRIGSEVLGNSSYKDLIVFATLVDSWAAKILQACRSEAKT